MAIVNSRTIKESHCKVFPGMEIHPLIETGVFLFACGSARLSTKSCAILSATKSVIVPLRFRSYIYIMVFLEAQTQGLFKCLAVTFRNMSCLYHV